jgi:hypothetical protein
MGKTIASVRPMENPRGRGLSQARWGLLSNSVIKKTRRIMADMISASVIRTVSGHRNQSINIGCHYNWCHHCHWFRTGGLEMT